MLAFALPLGACSVLPSGSASGTATPSLQGAEWVVEDIDGAGVLDRARATLNFGADGRVSGSSSCNSYTGPYTLSGNVLSFGNLATTRRACPPALMEQETRFLGTLAAVRSVEIAPDGALVLRGEAGRSIKARRG